MYKKEYMIRSTEIDSNIKEERNQLVHIGVVISTLVIIATVASILFSTFNNKPVSFETASVGKVEPA